MVDAEAVPEEKTIVMASSGLEPEEWQTLAVVAELSVAMAFVAKALSKDFPAVVLSSKGLGFVVAIDSMLKSAVS